MRSVTRLIFVLILCVLAGTAVAATARLTGFVTDPLTGVALGGYDPMSYFTDAGPEKGRADFEYHWQGVPWHFANAANRDAFARAPEVYAPQFGGHGTMSMARGFLSDGNPTIYAVMDDRLYLFYSAGNREAFLQSDKTARLKAMDTWQVLSETRLPR